jgi:hypothetical protein
MEIASHDTNCVERTQSRRSSPCIPKAPGLRMVRRLPNVYIILVVVVDTRYRRCGAGGTLRNALIVP